MLALPEMLWRSGVPATRRRAARQSRRKRSQGTRADASRLQQARNRERVGRPIEVDVGGSHTTQLEDVLAYPAMLRRGVQRGW